MVAAGLVVGGGAVMAAPLVLTAVGFGSAGVVGGSIAAAWQATIGNVAAGSFFAACQSAGAAGISATTSAAIGSAGAAVGSGLSYLGSAKNQGTNEPEDSDGMKGCVCSNGSVKRRRETGEVTSSSSLMERVGVVCGYTMGMVILCMAAAILINHWISTQPPAASLVKRLPDIRDPKVRQNVWKVVQDVKVAIAKVGRSSEFDKVKRLWDSHPVARNDAAAATLFPATHSAALILTLIVTSIATFFS